VDQSVTICVLHRPNCLPWKLDLEIRLILVLRTLSTALGLPQPVYSIIIYYYICIICMYTSSFGA
jgi:hypothetical protein